MKISRLIKLQFTLQYLLLLSLLGSIPSFLSSSTTFPFLPVSKWPGHRSLGWSAPFLVFSLASIWDTRIDISDQAFKELSEHKLSIVRTINWFNDRCLLYFIPYNKQILPSEALVGCKVVTIIRFLLVLSALSSEKLSSQILSENSFWLRLINTTKNYGSKPAGNITQWPWWLFDTVDHLLSKNNLWLSMQKSWFKMFEKLLRGNSKRNISTTFVCLVSGPRNFR